MWGLHIKETNSMFMRNAWEDDIFCKVNGNCRLYLIPCICVLNNNQDKIEIIWVHSKLRRRGFGRLLVETVDVDGDLKPSHPLPESIPFWKACGMLQ